MNASITIPDSLLVMPNPVPTSQCIMDSLVFDLVERHERPFHRVGFIKSVVPKLVLGSVLINRFAPKSRAKTVFAAVSVSVLALEMVERLYRKYE